MPIGIQCSQCKNYLIDLKCPAFPDGIPEDILTDAFEHTTKHPQQDNTILFEREVATGADDK